MSLHPNPNFVIPEETRRVAQAAFPKGTLCLSIAEVFGSLYHDDQFAALFPDHGQPATSPARLALVSVLQYVEGLSDRQAADAVRGHIDWKYALALELTDPGFDHTVLSEFVPAWLRAESNNSCWIPSLAPSTPCSRGLRRRCSRPGRSFAG